MLSRALEMAQILNEELKEHAGIIATTIVATLAAEYLLKAAYHYSVNSAQFIRRNWPSPFFDKKSLQKSAAQALHHFPWIGPIIEREAEKELAKLSLDIQHGVDKHRRKLGPVIATIPERGYTKEFILSIIERANEEYEQHLQGRVSGMMYARKSADYSELLDRTYSLTKFTNPMHDEEFPLIDKMAAEVLAMSQSLFNGDVAAFANKSQKKLSGLITDGGTVSIMEACSAYVKYAKAQGITEPEIIIPSTAHVSFFNAAERFGATLLAIPVNPTTGMADVTAMEKAITKNTCMMVGSAPSFPCGVFDPIKELADIAKQHKVPLHVDACLGGFLFPFAKHAGFKVPDCDFSVSGVLSMSVDPHKYGNTGKGSSLLLFHPDNPASACAIFTSLTWAGGMYVAQGMKGSRQGHVIATTWAAFMYHGMEGYTYEAKGILEFTRKLSAAISQVPHIRLLYPTQLSVIAISTDNDIDPYLVVSRLKKRHWNLSTIQQPAGFHFCITAAHTDHQDMIMREFVDDLHAATQYAKQHPFEKPGGTAGVYGMLPEVPDFLENRIGNMYASIHNSLSPELLDDSARRQRMV